MASGTDSKPRKGAGRVVFFAHLEQVQALMKAGNGQRAIYDILGGGSALGISYSQFNRYVNRYLIGPELKPREAVRTSEPQILGTVKSLEAPNKSAGSKRSGFQYDPSSAHKRDDLI